MRKLENLKMRKVLLLALIGIALVVVGRVMMTTTVTLPLIMSSALMGVRLSNGRMRILQCLICKLMRNSEM